jgi:poly-gamma-glutamate capsule biosynthesis protein CapA/YwtB (metallophosphatase superfamily)
LVVLTGTASARESPVASPEPVPVGVPAAAKPAVAAPARQRLVVVAGGDVSFGREAGQTALADSSYRPFRGIEPLWADADLRIVNLESQLTDQRGETQSPYDRLVFAGPPAGAEILSASGIHVVSTANNHAWDYGKAALFETLVHLDRGGVRHAGTGATLDDAERAVELEIRGYRVALFSVTQIWNYGEFAKHPGREHVAWADAKRLGERLRAARATHDLVFVSFHGGSEYVNAPGEMAKKFVDRAMDAGPDALFGHHPHVVHGVRWFGERPAFHSLGNLVFGSRRGYPWTRYGMLARMIFEEDGTRRVSLCPYRIEIGSHEPQVLDGRYGAYDRGRFYRHFARVSAEIGSTALSEPDAFGCFAITPGPP